MRVSNRRVTTNESCGNIHIRYFIYRYAVRATNEVLRVQPRDPYDMMLYNISPPVKLMNIDREKSTHIYTRRLCSQGTA